MTGYWCGRQFEAEQKLRAQKSSPAPQALDDDSSDALSTKDGVLHEESFHETKNEVTPNGEHDVETAIAAPDNQGLMSTLKIVNWWQVTSSSCRAQVTRGLRICCTQLVQDHCFAMH